MARVRRKLNHWLGGFRYRLERTHKPDLFAALMHQFLEAGDRSFSFIQIGANDGLSNDPLNPFITSGRYRARGVAVEPIPEYFALLQQRYSGFAGIEAVNAAIHNELSTAILYTVKEESRDQLPAQTRGVSSFDREHLLKTVGDEQHIKPVTVPCLTLDALAQQHGLPTPDLLQIDTEGYDYAILSQMDFNRLRPQMIHFEHGLRDGVMSQAQLDELIKLFNRAGYQVLAENYDATAFLPELFVRRAGR